MITDGIEQSNVDYENRLIRLCLKGNLVILRGDNIWNRRNAIM